MTDYMQLRADILKELNADNYDAAGKGTSERQFYDLIANIAATAATLAIKKHEETYHRKES